MNAGKSVSVFPIVSALNIFNSNKTNLSDHSPGNPKTLLALLGDVEL